MLYIRTFLLFCLLGFLLLSSPSSESIVGIDFGTAWFKVASVKNLEIVLNKQSKRKTESVLHLGDEQWHFGSQAVSKASKFPKQFFPNLKTVIGKALNSTSVQNYLLKYGHDYLPEHPRSTLHFKVNNEDYSVEELVGMILHYAKKMTEDYTKLKVTGAVITIPPFFNQFERQAILNAAEIAKLNVISLIHDTTAVGFFYGAQKNFPNPEKHVFLDVGAGSTIASLISFSSLKKLKTMEVKHVGYDVELGGNWIDGLLFSFLEGKFKEQHPDLTVNFKSDPAVHYLLNKEATRVKEILSLNTDVNVVLENIYKGRTLKTKVSRDEFNTLLTPHKERFLRPLNEILISNPDLVGENATLNSLVLVGGSTRVPLLQSWIAELIGKGKIASNVNSDEAPSLGAVLYAAKLTPGYRVGAINLLDTLPYNIQMNKSILFLENSETFPKTKSVTLKKASFQSMEILTRDNEVLGTAQFGPFNESASQLNVKVFVNQNGVLSLLNATQLTETSSFFSGKSNLTSPVDFNWTVVIPPMDKTAIEKSRTRLNVWKNKENDIRFREQTMNDFVTLVYELSSRMDERVIVRLTTEEERSKVMQKQSEMLSWLEEHSSSATLPQLQAQFLALKESIKDVMTRKTQWVSGVNSLHEYAEELKDTSLESWVADEEAKEKYNLDILQAKVTEVHAKVLEKREQERIQREKERLAKEEEERKAREKILEEVKKKLEAQKLEKEAAEKKTSHEKVNNATTSSNPTTTNTAGESPESDAADILPSSDAEIQVEPIQTDEDPIREDL